MRKGKKPRGRAEGKGEEAPEVRDKSLAPSTDHRHRIVLKTGVHASVLT